VVEINHDVVVRIKRQRCKKAEGKRQYMLEKDELPVGLIESKPHKHLDPRSTCSIYIGREKCIKLIPGSKEAIFDEEMQTRLSVMS
jgi:hypothetical protein